LFGEHSTVRKSDATPQEDAQLGSSPRLVPDIIDPLLALEVRHRAGSVVVRVTGDLDISTAFELRDLLADILSEGPPSELVLDLLGLHSVDSTGLDVFQLAQARARAGGFRFVLANPNTLVSALLEIRGLVDALDIVAPASPNPARYASSRGSRRAGRRLGSDPGGSNSMTAYDGPFGSVCDT
jgi:anti-sigma B factor antagonist